MKRINNGDSGLMAADKIYENDVKLYTSFAVTKPDWFNFIESPVGVWSVSLLADTIYFGDFGTKTGNDEVIISIPDGYNYFYGNRSTGEITALPAQSLDDDLVFLGIAYPGIDLFSMNIPYAVNGKPYNISIPIPARDLANYIVTKPEWFNIKQVAGVWKIDILNGTIAYGTGENASVNIGNDTILLEANAFNYIYIDKSINKVVNSATINNNEILILMCVCLPVNNIFYSICPYAVNGKPYNIDTAAAPIADIFNVINDTPLLSNTIAFKENEGLPIYRDSIFKSIDGGYKSRLTLETTVNGVYKRYDIHNPTYITRAMVGTSARYIVEGRGIAAHYYKDAKIYAGLIANLPAAFTIMGFGDSLYQGNANTNVAVIALIKDKFATYGTTVTTVGTFNQDDGRGYRNDIISEGRGFWSYKSFTGKDNYAYEQPISIATGTGQTGKFQNPFLRLATGADKTAHPDWCFTNKVANPADPDGVSYATNNTYTNYYIFDAVNYLTVRGLTAPDVLTMSLGINDWQESSINIEDEFLCFKIMYLQLRAAMPTTKIIITPTNGIFYKEQASWQNEMFLLAERIIKYLEEAQVSDTNLYICPIYAHVSRGNAGAFEENTAPISEYNNVIASTTYDVHVLDKATSRAEYMEPLENLLLAIL